MRAYNMKLNPTKCAFGVSAGNFLGFMVTQRRIEVNPGQIKVVLETAIPNSKKELQHLTGRLAALGHFIARFIDKLRPFFLTLKGASTFGWTDECKQTFEIVKCYLTEPSILSNPKSSEQLCMYLAVYECAVSIVPFRHIQDKEQMLVDYVSKAMVDVETRYSRMEQTALTLRNATQKLCLYFQAHQVTVLTNQPL